MAVVALQLGEALAPKELLEFLSDRLPHFMLPRYVRTVLDFPHTETAKIRKHVLCGEGVTPDTWDRDAAGISVHSRRFN
jgi:crotonobetaine/carnitine-CoA ligase